MKYLGILSVVVAFVGMAYGGVTTLYPSTDRSITDGATELGVNMWAETEETVQAGDTGASNEEVRGVMEFGLSSVDIANATNITLQLTVANSVNTAFDWVVVHMVADNDGSITLDDYQAPAAQVSPVYAGSTAAGTVITLDVTSLVKADAISADWAAFRIQVSDPDAVSDGDSNPERATVWSSNASEITDRPQLIVEVPDSASLVSYSYLTPSTDKSINGNDSDYGVTLWGETDQTLEAGDTAASNEEVRGVLEFDLSSVNNIAAAGNIFLQVTVAPYLNTPFDWVLMHMTSGNDGTIVAGDYQASATQISPVLSGTTEGGTVLTLDVTSLVQDDALSGDWSAFRIQVADPDNVSDGDGNPERAKVWSSNASDESYRPQLIVAFAGLSSYESWAMNYGLSGDDTARTADLEYGGLGDGMNNLVEYALGGNPTNDDAAAVLPSFTMSEESGTNWLYYVHRERTNETQLTYTVQLAADLVGGSWQTNGVVFVGESAAVDNFKSVTNRTDVGSSSEFLRLQIQEN